MSRVETRELEYFLAVAEELHFGRAAERLGIAQPPLSRAIARLERRLGVRLLERTSRRAELTAAGAVLLEEARTALGALDTMVERVRRAGSRLVVAVRPGTGAGVLAEVVRRHERDTGVRVDVVFRHDQPRAVREGVADVALVCAGEDLTGLRTQDLAEERAVVLLPADHELAGRESVEFAELTAEPGFSPNCPPLPLSEVLDRVALGRLLVLVGDGVSHRTAPGVATVPVRDLPATRLVLAWDGARSTLDRPAFLRTARAVARADRELAVAARG
jgi:DNA-binding transcriptional LysR family regulator